MFFKSSQRSLSVLIDKEAWEDVREMLNSASASSTKIVYQPDVLHKLCHRRAPLDIIQTLSTIDPELLATPSETGGDLPLHYAVASGQLSMVEFITKFYPQGVAVRCHRQGAFGSTVTPLHVAVTCHASLDIIQVLLYYAPLNTRSLRNDDGKTPFALVRDNDQVLLRMLRPPKRTNEALSATIVLLLATGVLWYKSLETWTRLWTVWIRYLWYCRGCPVLVAIYLIWKWQPRYSSTRGPISMTNVMDHVVWLDSKRQRLDSSESTQNSMASTSDLSCISMDA